MNKEIIRETMLSLEADDLESAREKYFEYVASAKLDRSEPIDNDEQGHAEMASDLSEALDDTVHDHAEKIDRLHAIDFGPKSSVEEGALVKLSGRQFIIAVSTAQFFCDGHDVIGISTMAPIYAEMEGLHHGESFEFKGRSFVVEAVA